MAYACNYSGRIYYYLGEYQKAYIALEAAKEEAMTAQAEEELFAWIESTNKIRGKAIAKLAEILKD